MSNVVRRNTKRNIEQKVTVAVQILSILESEAQKKNFFQRFSIAMKYLFFKKFDAFFKEGK